MSEKVTYQISIEACHGPGSRNYGTIFIFTASSLEAVIDRANKFYKMKVNEKEDDIENDDKTP